ncbi:DUF1752 and DUF3295 domain-containing protein [Phanerochaete sordida]|uniref:DUF1752 and DUF3295 domain-containing protein n=1 Tax=Phanerochaete sordida TaxID=48140 RepID=A0A9P3LC16_9APHY|nr:DUF1752 and DUF3295 domain-containing protein [Phanerochaete sordida]
MIDFPSPILSVSAEVLKELDGEDALFGMWTVFTKCKESLKDGRRLENISWRLWHREMSLSPSLESSSSSSSSSSIANTRCATPITPVSEAGPTHAVPVPPGNDSNDSLRPTATGPTRHSWHGEDVPHAATRRLSTASMPVRPRTRSSSAQRVGSIIADILPSKMVVPVRTHTYPGSKTNARKHTVPGSGSGTARPSPAQSAAPTVTLAQPKPQCALPTVQLPATPPNLGAPRVVVVNPTPHPTPPATPHPSHTATFSGPAPTHLAPPPVRPALTMYQPAPPSASKATTATPSPLKADASGANPEKASAAVPHAATVQSRNDETLKASDRRFFLQTAESPDQDSPERPVQPAGSRTPVDAPEPSPSNSATSSRSHVKSDAPPPKRVMSRPNVRRGKDVARFATVRAGKATAHRPAIQKRATEPKKTTFNIGSVSSNGTSRDGKSSETRSPLPHLSKAVPKPRPPSPAKQPAAGPARKGLVMSTSSDYSTDSDDDSEWASDNSTHSVDEKEKERQREETRFREAAEEAQRQRDLFAKVPKRSYSNLNRSKSGLLSQLLNPDPTIFPSSHSYRTSYSSQDMTQLAKQGGGRLPPTNHLTSRSSVAVPLATQITPLTAQVSPSNGANQPYRPKGRPEGAEMESDSEDDQDNGIQVSRSLAQQKLAALAGPSRRRTADQALPQMQAPPRPPVSHQPVIPRAAVEDQRTAAVTTVPIPLGHPYNLPAPAPPMTPRTTRRQMLSTELSESLRRNLLWERQVSKLNLTSGARRGGLIGSRLQMTAANPDQQGGGSQGQRGTPDEQEQRRLAAKARTRSWADDYHYAGW